MRELRNDIRYRNVVDEILNVPKEADTRDTEAVKRLATGFLKLLFPHVSSVDMLDRQMFERYCFQPAMAMRGVIRKQLHLLDSEYGEERPKIVCSGS